MPYKDWRKASHDFLKERGYAEDSEFHVIVDKIADWFDTSEFMMSPLLMELGNVRAETEKTRVALNILSQGGLIGSRFCEMDEGLVELSPETVANLILCGSNRLKNIYIERRQKLPF